MDFMGRARRQTDEKSALAALRGGAQEVSELLATGLTGAACESALSGLVPAARDHLDQHRSMTASVPNALWACGEAAFSRGALDLAAPLLLGAARCALFTEGGAGQGELVHSSHRMTLASLQAVLDLAKQRKTLNELPAERKLELINSMNWPYLRSPTEMFKGVADLISMFYRTNDQSFRLMAIALGTGALDLEPFIPPQDLDGRLAAQETRFWLGIVMSASELVPYESVDEQLRQGLSRIAEMDQPGVVLDGGSLARALNALKFLLFTTGNLSPLISLEMAFDGLDGIEQLTLEVPDDPLLQAGLRSRIRLRWPVASGFGLRLSSVLHTLDTNERTRLQDLIDRTHDDGPN
ncbi:hypothetical protein UG55_102999 [Frankia sp. EI5c]|nr:hypothetical protein UG55_102999 [Frankia sp. EI5c]